MHGDEVLKLAQEALEGAKSAASAAKASQHLAQMVLDKIKTGSGVSTDAKTGEKKAADVSHPRAQGVLDTKRGETGLSTDVKMEKRKAAEAVSLRSNNVRDFTLACIFAFYRIQAIRGIPEDRKLSEILMGFKLWALKSKALDPATFSKKDYNKGYEYEIIRDIKNLIRQLYHLLCVVRLAIMGRCTSRVQYFSDIEHIITRLEMLSFYAPRDIDQVEDPIFREKDYEDLRNHLRNVLDEPTVEYLTLRFPKKRGWKTPDPKLENKFPNFDEIFMKESSDFEQATLRKKMQRHLIKANLERRHSILLLGHPTPDVDEDDYHPDYAKTEEQFDRVTQEREFLLEMENLRPYTCVATDCPEPDELYSSREDWETHLKEKHAPVWMCDKCNNPDEIFRVEQRFRDHRRAIHGRGTDDQHLVDSCELRPLGLKSCPLCSFSAPMLSKNFKDHVVEHAVEFALHAIPSQPRRVAKDGVYIRPLYR